MVHLGWTKSRIYIPRWIQNRSYNSNRVIFLTVSKDGIILTNSSHLKFRSVNCLRISRPFKQLSKVFVRCCSQGCLFGKFPANYYRRICGGVFIFRAPFDRGSEVSKLFFETDVIKQNCKKLRWKSIKNESCKSYLGNIKNNVFKIGRALWFCEPIFLRARLGVQKIISSTLLNNYFYNEI